MAVRKRAKGGDGYHSFSSRMPKQVYDDLNEWAWENRISLAAACGMLLGKAVAAERGGEYKPGKLEEFLDDQQSAALTR